MLLTGVKPITVCSGETRAMLIMIIMMMMMISITIIIIMIIIIIIITLMIIQYADMAYHTLSSLCSLSCLNYEDVYHGY